MRRLNVMSRDAEFNTAQIRVVDADVIKHLKMSAEQSPRRRCRLCLHYSEAMLTQEMIIVCCRDTFMPPHRHPPGKSESYHVIEGGMTVYYFNDHGAVIDHTDLAEPGQGKPFFVRLSEPVWHMPVPSSRWLVYHETYSGPFRKEHDVIFPDWSPSEYDKENVAQFMKRVTRK